MSAHPSDDALIASARAANPSVLAHVQGCSRCRTRHRRLAAGAVLLEEARRDSVPAIDWRSIDARVFAAAETAAADARRRAGRQGRGVGPTVYAGALLAAAAAALIAFGTSRAHHPQSGTSIATAPQGARSRSVTRSGTPSTTPGAAARRSGDEPVEGVVLMVVAPVAYTAPGGVPAALTGRTSLRQGGRLAADARGGRAVVALRAGCRLDARAGADVTFARLSRAATDVSLQRGEARLDGEASPDARVTIRASGWTLVAKGGAFVTKIEPDLVRVRVVDGTIGVSRGEGSEREVLAGNEIELASDREEMRVVSHAARDADAVDTAFLDRAGEVVELPRPPIGAQLSVVGHGPLPSGVVAMRASRALEVHARLGGEDWTLSLAPGSTPAWRHTPRGAQAVVAAREPEAVIEAPTAPAASEGVTESAGSASPRALTAGEISEADAAVARQIARSRLATWVAACFEQCERAANCGIWPHGAGVTLDPNMDGSNSDARASRAGSAQLRECIQHSARHFALPRVLRYGSVFLEIERP